MTCTIDDRRTGLANPWGFVVFTDRFMSGWGKAPGRSLFALPVASPKEAETVLENGKNRADMQRGRIVSSLKNVKRGLRDGDHLSIRDREDASRWYEPAAW